MFDKTTMKLEDRTLEARLARESTGEVLFDPFSRGRYATDASFYQIMPAGVVVPRSIDAALRGRAGHRARRSQPQAQAARAVVPGRYFDRLASDHRRHGGQ